MEFAIPHAPGAAPNNPLTGPATTAQAFIIIDPLTGMPITAAGVVQSVGASTGKSLNGSTGIVSALIIPPGTFQQFCVIQNNSANVIHLSFNTPATLADFSLAAGVSVTLPVPFANALNAIASVAASTWAAIGV